MTPGAEKLFADCARRRIRGRPLDGGSIPPISTNSRVSNEKCLWLPGEGTGRVSRLGTQYGAPTTHQGWWGLRFVRL